MKYSKKGLSLTEGFEKLRLAAYQDSGGVWTIGYGHTHCVYPGMTCTKDQAEAWLLSDMTDAENTVNHMVKVPLTQGEYDALVDLVFNIGSGNLHGSTVLALLNAGNYKDAALHIEDWDKCKGQELVGLLRRRLAEEDEFIEGMA